MDWTAIVLEFDDLMPFDQCKVLKHITLPVGVEIIKRSRLPSECNWLKGEDYVCNPRTKAG